MKRLNSKKKIFSSNIFVFSNRVNDNGIGKISPFSI